MSFRSNPEVSSVNRDEKEKKHQFVRTLWLNSIADKNGHNLCTEKERY